MHQIFNVLENKIIFSSGNESEVISFVTKIAKENEDSIRFVTVTHAALYINDFCSNLTYTYKS